MYADFDPSFGVPIAEKPEDIVIVVMGGTGTHSLSVQTRLASRNITVPHRTQRRHAVASQRVSAGAIAERNVKAK